VPVARCDLSQFLKVYDDYDTFHDHVMNDMDFMPIYDQVGNIIFSGPQAQNMACCIVAIYCANGDINAVLPNHAGLLFPVRMHPHFFDIVSQAGFFVLNQTPSTTAKAVNAILQVFSNDYQRYIEMIC
jgi:hypothetical protein